MSRHRPPAGGQTGHADDWLMTYADTITLLLCLLAVLLALNGAKLHGAADVTRPVSAAAPAPSALPQAAIVVAPFRELAGMPRPAEDTDDDPDDRTSHPDNPPANRALPLPDSSPAAPPPAVSFETATVARFGPVPVARPLPIAAPTGPAAEGQRTADADHAPDPPPQAATSSLAGATSAPEQRGDRITIFQFSSAAFFASGSATLSDSGQSILESLRGRLQSPKFAAYRITVEGHTDDEPIRGPPFPSNWELSVARAVAVVRFFVEHGIRADRLRAAGYADTRPLAPNRDAEGNPIPANRAMNRRVVIELEKIDHAEN
jgi:flagellar motor protein MotB